MKLIINSLRLFLIVALFIAALLFVLKFTTRAPREDVTPSLNEIILFSVYNGLLLSFFATLFLTLIYYYNVAKTARHNKKVRNGK